MKVAIVLDSSADFNRKKGGITAITVMSKTLSQLGADVSILCSGEIHQAPETVCVHTLGGAADSGALADVTQRVIEGGAFDLVVFFDFPAINLAKRLQIKSKTLNVAYLGLPPDDMYWARFRANAGSASAGAWLRAFRNTARLWVGRHQLRGSCDIVLAADPRNAQRNRGISRSRRWLRYPAPVPDSHPPINSPSNIQNEVLAINAQGTISLSSEYYFVRHIVPNIHKSDTDIPVLHFVGRERFETLNNLPEHAAQRIKMSEFLDPIEPTLQQCLALLACTPVAIGSSVRVKTALRCGVPPIVHPAVCSGLPELEDGKNCIVARDGKAFVDAFRRVSKDRQLRETLGAEARRTYERHFSCAAATEFWSDFIENFVVEQNDDNR